MKKAIAWILALTTAASLSIGAHAAATPPTAAQSAAVSITINGKSLAPQGFMQGDAAMIPVRAVCEALGFTVTWNADRTVHLNNGVMQTRLTIGEDRYVVYTANPDLVGMSAPFSLGAAPVLRDNTTYVPATLLPPLYGNDSEILTVADGAVAIHTEQNAQIPNPMTEHDTQAALERAVGFSLKLPAMSKEFSAHYFDISGELAQVVYERGETQITFRMSRGEQDISGDYTDYSITKTVSVKGNIVTLRGDRAAMHGAIWASGGYCYSLYAPDGMSEALLLALAKSTL